jgi:hypothetical protein
MKSILYGIIVIAIVSLMAWAIAPWMLLLWFARGYHVDVKISPKDITKTVEVEVETKPQKEPEIPEIELEDYWYVSPEEESVEAESLPVMKPEVVEIKEEDLVAEPALVFPSRPKNLQELTTRQLQLLCGEINKIRRGSITGYRNKKDKDKQVIIEKVEAFYQTI